MNEKMNYEVNINIEDNAIWISFDNGEWQPLHTRSTILKLLQAISYPEVYEISIIDNRKN